LTKLYKIISQQKNVNANVIFVHGLGGHPTKTWMNDGNSESSFWPYWLGESSEGLAIWTVGYDAPLSNWTGTVLDIESRADSLLQVIGTNSDLNRAPILFVCHSLGGIMVKKMLKIAADKSELDMELYGSFTNKVKGIVFMGTPHRGSSYVKVLVWLGAIFWPSIATQELTNNSQGLLSLHTWFINWKKIPKCLSFYERENDLFPPIVSRGSAEASIVGDAAIPLDSNHIDICKFSNSADPAFLIIIKFVTELTSQAGPLRSYSWRKEKMPDIEKSSFPKKHLAFRLAKLAIAGCLIWSIF